jgi:hypothetical protein
MATIDTRTVLTGRYFTEVEDRHAAAVCVIGDGSRRNFSQCRPRRPHHPRRRHRFHHRRHLRKNRLRARAGPGLVLRVPLRTYLKIRGQRNSLMLHVKAEGGAQIFELAQDDARRTLRARRHVPPGRDDDFFIGTAESYIELWKNISAAFSACS